MSVDTYGKGVPYNRIEPVTTEHSLIDFKIKFGALFHEFSRHLVPSWFLSNTKNEIMKPLSRRLSVLFSVTDFAENVVIDWKYELSEQHFHKREILLFGAVLSFAVVDTNGHINLQHYSYMVSSDYR